MTTMFWILWFFIAFIIVLVAFTLRKENEEMPRREILRAVESTGRMGFAERSFLWVFSWLDTRFRISVFLVKFNFIFSDFLILDSLKLSILKSETAAEKIATSAGKFFNVCSSI